MEQRLHRARPAAEGRGGLLGGQPLEDTQDHRLSLPGGEILGIEYEAFPILLFGLGGLVLVLVPFLDRNVVKKGRSTGFTVVGAVGLVYIVAMTAWGYHSLVPAYVVLATAAVMLILGLATRQSGEER